MKDKYSLQPLRTCVGCRQIKGKKELIRLCVRKDSEGFNIDVGGKMSGRGAYLCPRTACIKEGVRKKAFNRSLKVNIKDEIAKRLREEILAALERELKIILNYENELNLQTEYAKGLSSVLSKKKAEEASNLWYKYCHIKNVLL